VLAGKQIAVFLLAMILGNQFVFCQQNDSTKTSLTQDSISREINNKLPNKKLSFSTINFPTFEKKSIAPDKEDTVVKSKKRIRVFDKKSSLKEGSVFNKLPTKSKLGLKKIHVLDSISGRNFLKRIITKSYGNINAGYDYGIIPFAANIKYPMGYFSTQGNVGASVLGIPLVATYYYSDLKNISGLNNYFRVSFDVSAYKQLTNIKSFEKLSEQKEILNSLNQVKQQLTQKLNYAQISQNNLPSINSMAEPNNNLQQVIPTSKPSLPITQTHLGMVDSIKNEVKDSLKKNTHSKPTSILSDSLRAIQKAISKKDSLSQKISYYEEYIQKIEQQIKSVQNKIDMIQHPAKLETDNPFIAKARSLFDGVKKMEVGMCYPNYSTFLVSGSSLKGINLEWEKKFYLAFTYGKTINTIYTTNNLIQNQLQTGRNLYNFFDFNNVKDSRKIAALKFGYGKKEGTHLYAGVLYGVGLASYVGHMPQSSLEKNLVMELDGRVKINASNTLDLVYGKSALYQVGLPQTDNSLSSNFPLNKVRSNAALARYTLQLTKIKAKLIATGRLVDPFFISYGVGFIRSDNLRYEIKWEQEIASKIKLSAFYRKDRDNLLNAYAYTTQLQTAGATLSIKLNSKCSFKGTYSPVIQNITSKDSGQQVSHHINSISTAILNYNMNRYKTTGTLSVLYSYYNLAGTSNKSNNFQNYQLNYSLLISQRIKNDLAISYFYNNDNDSLNNNTYMLSEQCTFSAWKGVTVSAALKWAYNSLIANQFGGLLKVSVPVIKHVRLELCAEKLVIGDFYSTYNQSEIKKFPFYGYTKLNISW
jgi:hypothetical protein